MSLCACFAPPSAVVELPGLNLIEAIVCLQGGWKGATAGKSKSIPFRLYYLLAMSNGSVYLSYDLQCRVKPSN